jgi:hypothetical protein
MIYDWRESNPHRKSLPFQGRPCQAFDAKTNEWIGRIFYYDTELKKVGRYSHENGKYVFEGTRIKEIWESRELIFEEIKPEIAD